MCSLASLSLYPTNPLGPIELRHPLVQDMGPHYHTILLAITITPSIQNTNNQIPIVILCMKVILFSLLTQVSEDDESLGP
jgi:hypothetical protein